MGIDDLDFIEDFEAPFDPRPYFDLVVRITQVLLQKGLLQQVEH